MIQHNILYFHSKKSQTINLRNFCLNLAQIHANFAINISFLTLNFLEGK
jgi:hypothetical protein